MTPLPERLGKYQVTGVLGEGAMGVVYKGFDPGIGRTVALKTIRRSLMQGDDASRSSIARFRNEAQAAGRLQHPGIVAVYDFGDEGELSYIAMEFVEGSTLSRYLATDVRFADDDILSLMTQLLDALDHAHAKGVWHRDIKPGNLLLTNDGRLKIADFGIARIESMALTQVTSIVGTPGYMAPEQFLGKGVDRRADLYAAGVLLYQLLVGRQPFVGTPESLMYRVVHESPVLPSGVPGFDRGTAYDPIIAAALAKTPDQRFASAWEFKRSLMAVTGRPAAATVSEDTMVTVLAKRPPAPAPLPTAGTANPSNWDPAVLQQVETSLAKHVGPLASVLVKRSARECADLPSLYVKLAEQVTNPSARQAFLAGTQGTRTAGTGGTGGTGTTRAPATQPTATAPSLRQAAVTDAVVAAATKLLAQHLGPIAGVVARRAAAKQLGRDAFYSALAEAVSDPAARQKLRAELDKLP